MNKIGFCRMYYALAVTHHKPWSRGVTLRLSKMPERLYTSYASCGFIKATMLSGGIASEDDGHIETLKGNFLRPNLLAVRVSAASAKAEVSAIEI